MIFGIPMEFLPLCGKGGRTSNTGLFRVSQCAGWGCPQVMDNPIFAMFLYELTITGI